MTMVCSWSPSPSSLKMTPSAPIPKFLLQSFLLCSGVRGGSAAPVASMKSLPRPWYFDTERVARSEVGVRDEEINAGANAAARGSNRRREERMSRRGEVECIFCVGRRFPAEDRRPLSGKWENIKHTMYCNLWFHSFSQSISCCFLLFAKNWKEEKSKNFCPPIRISLALRPLQTSGPSPNHRILPYHLRLLPASLSRL